MNAPDTVTDPALERALRELRAIRTFLPGIAHIIDNGTPRNTEAWEAVQGAMAQLDDCIDSIERPDADCTCREYARQEGVPEFNCPVHGVASEQPTSPLALERLMDLQADADRSVER